MKFQTLPRSLSRSTCLLDPEELLLLSCFGGHLQSHHHLTFISVCREYLSHFCVAGAATVVSLCVHVSKNSRNVSTRATAFVLCRRGYRTIVKRGREGMQVAENTVLAPSAPPVRRGGDSLRGFLYLSFCTFFLNFPLHLCGKPFNSPPQIDALFQVWPFYGRVEELLLAIIGSVKGGGGPLSFCESLFSLDVKKPRSVIEASEAVVG